MELERHSLLYINLICILLFRPILSLISGLRVVKIVHFLNAVCFIIFIPSVINKHCVVKSEEEAADTGSLLTHFICLALGLLSIKQMARHCMISRVESPSAPLPQEASGFWRLSLCLCRSETSGRRGLHDT